MTIQRTLSIIKPDGVKKNVIGQIIAKFEAAGLRPVAMRMTTLSASQAGGFYGGWITDEIVGPFKGEAGTGGW